MNILVLHNGNLPVPFMESWSDGKFDYYVQNAFRPEDESSVDNYDLFVHGRLGGLFDGMTKFDAVVMPFSFSTYDYTEYTGLRTALHIRLTESWGHKYVPFLFLGPDTVVQAGKLSPDGGILFTTGIYASSASDRGSLKTELQKICGIHSKMTPEDNDEWYGNFLDKINVGPPADYDSPYSFSNEWTLLRWKEMFDWEDDGPQVSDEILCSTLYFKYVMASSGKRVKFRRKNRKNPMIPGIEGKSFVLIDDAADRGWKSMLEYVIVKESRGKLFCFDKFRADERQMPDTGLLERDELLDSIDAFIAEPAVSQADCYIVDMHLCQGDEDAPLEELTGMEVVRRLKKANIANQIVIFTASGQARNLKSVMSGMNLAGYVVKEDPRENFSRAESYRVFCDFSAALSKAVRLSSVKKYVCLTERYAGLLGDDAGLIEDIIDLMLADSPEFTAKPMILDIIILHENYLKGKYNVCDDGKVYSRVRGRGAVADYEDMVCFLVTQEDGHSNVVDVRFIDKGSGRPSGWVFARNSDIRDIVVPLYFCYGVSEADCRTIVRLKMLRNTRVAHGGGDIDISPAVIMGVCENVIFPMLERDFPGYKG